MTNHPHRSKISRIVAHHPSRTWIDPGDWQTADRLTVAIPQTDRVQSAPVEYAEDHGTGVLARKLDGIRWHAEMLAHPVKVEPIGYNREVQDIAVVVPVIIASPIHSLYDIKVRFALHHEGDITPLLRIGDSGGEERKLGRFGDTPRMTAKPLSELAAALRNATRMNSVGQEMPSLPSDIDFDDLACRIIEAALQAHNTARWLLVHRDSRGEWLSLIHRDDSLAP